MTQITLSVRDFALPVPRVGSIEANSGYGAGASDGLLIHQAVQQAKAEADENYQAEVAIAGNFSKGDYTFVVAGRIDGLYLGKVPKIEEIKSAFNIKDLKKKLSEEQNTHPYCLQLKTYGYLQWKLTGITPDLGFYLVSSRNRQTDTLVLKWDVDIYEEWVDRRLEELVVEAERSEALVRRRKKWAQGFQFPFETPRTGQMELVSEIERGIQESSRMLIQAPTGLGKTAGVLYPMLKESLSRGQNTIYVTPKNSQHSVAEDAVDRFKAQGTPVRSLTLTAKSKICFKNEPLCNPTYCEFAKDHYTKVAAHDLGRELSKKRKLGMKTFEKLGAEFEVCPFELQFEAAKEADVVIGDYNYVFSPRSAVGRIASTAGSREGKPNLVIDEAHNLFVRALGYYSPEVSISTLEKMRESIEYLPKRFQSEVDRLIDDCQATIRACHPDGATKPQLIDAPTLSFMDQDSNLRAFLSRYLESDVEIQPRDVVLRLSYYWSEFTSALEFVTAPKRPEFFTTFRPAPDNGGSLRITCCDASDFIRECYDAFAQVVGFSATLKPFDYYAKLSGLDPAEIKVSEFQSPFAKSQRKLLIIPEISTKYSNREKNYDKVSAVIERVSAVKPGNYFAFFPSFEFLDRVHQRLKAPGFMILAQSRYMKAPDVEAVIEQLRGQTVPTLVLAVQGGVFSEGVDYPGQMLIGAFVIGPALPNFDLEREQMRAYYQQNYGEGFHYTYSYPAMSKAIQAAGRVVRSETDRGIIVLMDNRFLEANYARSMPVDWFNESPQELVSRSILKEVADFWEAPGLVSD